MTSIPQESLSYSENSNRIVVEYALMHEARFFESIDGRSHRILLPFTRDAHIVVKLIDNPDNIEQAIVSVKVWFGTTIAETTSRWNMSETEPTSEQRAELFNKAIEMVNQSDSLLSHFLRNVQQTYRIRETEDA